MSIYDTRVVAFIDILGFKEALKNEAKAEKIFNALNGIKNSIESHFSSDGYNRFKGVLDTEITAFSDSVVISGESTQATVVYHHALMFSELLIKNGFLCRGAICLGKLFHKNGILFGQAFVDAYNAESKRSVYPRIIVDAEVKDLINCSENEVGELDKLLRTDFDGELFIDISIVNEYNRQSEFIENRLESIVQLESDNKDKSIKQKHDWLIRTYRLQK